MREELTELPTVGLGDDFINEVYQLDEAGRDKFVILRGEDQQPKNNLRRNNNKLGLATAEVYRETNPSGGIKQTEVGEDIKEVLEALRGLVHILNTTSQGKRGPQGLARRKKRPQQATGTTYQVKDILLDGDAFSRIQSVRLPGLEQPVLLSAKQVPSPILQHGDNKNLDNNFNSSRRNASDSPSTTTIPPHLIPLGPDGRPILNPDGSLVASGHVSAGQHQLSQMFPYLSNSSPVAATTTAAAVASGLDNATHAAESGQNKTAEHKDMITSMIDTVRDLPMDTKRHMLANMMFGVPMAAITMAAAGVPHLAIAPLATIIPGFLFAAFTDTNPDPRAEGHGHGGHGHGQGQGHGHGHGPETREGEDAVGQPPQHGLAGLIAGLRQFYTHRRENMTLHIATDNSHRQHGKRSMQTIVE